MAITTIAGAFNVPKVYRNTALNSTAVQVSSTPVVLNGINIINTNGSSSNNAFVKFYNVASATVGTTAISRTIFCPHNSSVFISASEFGEMYFDTAMCVAVTTAISDSDTSAIATAIHIEIGYK